MNKYLFFFSKVLSSIFLILILGFLSPTILDHDPHQNFSHVSDRCWVGSPAVTPPSYCSLYVPVVGSTLQGRSWVAHQLHFYCPSRLVWSSSRTTIPLYCGIVFGSMAKLQQLVPTTWLCRHYFHLCLWQVPSDATNGEVPVSINDSVSLHLKITDALPKSREVLYRGTLAEKPRKIQLKVHRFLDQTHLTHIDHVTCSTHLDGVCSSWKE